MAETSHVYKRAPKVKLRRAQNVHWSTTTNHKILYLGQIKKHPLIVLFFFQKEEDQGLLFFFFQDGRQVFKFKMATNLSVQNDRQLVIYSYPTSKLSQNIHYMYFVKLNCLCMFFSIAFSLQKNANETPSCPI